MLGYPIRTEKDGDTYLATCRDFPELTTFGDTREDARLHAVDALEEAVAARIAHRQDIPEPSAGRNRVALPTQTALKVLVYQAMRRQNVTKADLARRLAWHAPQVDRLLDVRHATRMQHIDAALAALHKKVSVSLEEA